MSTIGQRIDQLFELRERKREHEEEIKKLQEEMSTLEGELMLEMDAQGIDKSAGKRAQVSIQESVKPNVQDWDQFYKFVKKHDAFYLLERRPSVTACREMFETKGKIPGVVPFIKRSVNLRTRD